MNRPAVLKRHHPNMPAQLRNKSPKANSAIRLNFFCYGILDDFYEPIKSQIWPFPQNLLAEVRRRGMATRIAHRTNETGQ